MAKQEVRVSSGERDFVKFRNWNTKRVISPADTGRFVTKDAAARHAANGKKDWERVGGLDKDEDKQLVDD